MSDENDRKKLAQDDEPGRHPYLLGVLTGAAVGVGIGLLFAPRTGAQMRKEIGHQLSNAKGSCSNGYHRAKDVAGDWADRSKRAYSSTREKVAHGAHETRLYVREVTDAVTLKSRTATRGKADGKADLAVAAPRETARANVTPHASPSAARSSGVTDVPVKEVPVKQGA
jgi:gas vesicle protein